MELRIGDAVLMAVANNPALKVEDLRRFIQATVAEQQRAVFDPVLSAEFSREVVNNRRTWLSYKVSDPTDTRETSGNITLEEYLPTGTKLSARAQGVRQSSSAYWTGYAYARGSLSVSQALLKGRGLGYNLARLRAARLETQITEYEFRAFVESFVSQVEQAYWDCALTVQQVEIVEEAVRTAQQQLKEVTERVEVGKLSETELAAAQAEVAVRQSDLTSARANRERARLRMLRLLNPGGTNSWRTQFKLLDAPVIPEAGVDDVEAHAQVALMMRPEMNQSRLQREQGDLEVVRTRNGLLPRLDGFVTLGMNGYGESFNQAKDDVRTSKSDVSFGMVFEFPLVNRDARAQHERARLNREQADLALENLAQAVEVDVRAAYVEVMRAKEQIEHTRTARRYREAALRAETDKFRVGKSTALLVAQAQRDYLLIQVQEVAAVVSYLKSMTDLFRLDGSLLKRRGLDVPGGEPVAVGVASAPR